MSEVVNTLATVWKILDDNTKLNINDLSANAVPANDPLKDLSDGQGPNYWEWEWDGPGLLKKDFWFHMRLNYMFGARYKGGGAFITSCWPEIVDYNIWTPGYSIDINGRVRDVQNVGSETAPIAQLVVAVSIRYQWVSSVMGVKGGTNLFVVKGDGKGHASWDDMSYEP